MAANSKQKLKLLYVYKILEQETDATHGLDAPGIIERLAEYGISAERKGIYRDISVLREFGLQIGTVQHEQTGWYLERTEMTLAELNLLIDAVQSCKFLTNQTSNRLVKRIRNLASIYEQEALSGRVHVDARVKSQSDSVFHNVDTLHAAMGRPRKDRRKISFLYQKYDNHMEKQDQHDGTLYVQTPVQVVFANGFYYLVAWSDEHNDMRHYRIDRMRLIQETTEPATHNEQIATYTYQDSDYQMFSMFDGKEQTVRLRVAEGKMDIIADMFGTDVRVKPLANDCAEVSVRVCVSPQFFGWIAGMDNYVTIAGPKAVATEYRSWLTKLAKQVESLGA